MSKDVRKTGDKHAPKPMTVAQLAALIGIGKFGGFARAEAISAMLRNNHISAIRDELLREPIDDAYTLLVLLGLEREREAGVAEKEAMELRRAQLSAAGKKGAETRHSQRGGSREKAEKLCSIWASGKYSTKKLCAEKECDALGMSFDTARKILSKLKAKAKPSP